MLAFQVYNPPNTVPVNLHFRGEKTAKVSFLLITFLHHELDCHTFFELFSKIEKYRKNNRKKLESVLI